MDPKAKLFAVLLGGRAARCNTELHDVVFAVGASLEATYPRLREKWFGLSERVHVDSWIELSVVDGHRVRLSSQPSRSERKLYFINLGAYIPGQFSEVHAVAFIVAASPQEVITRAKANLLLGLSSVHKDDLYDVDDCLEVNEVDGCHVHLEPTDDRAPLEPHSAYLPLPAGV